MYFWRVEKLEKDLKEGLDQTQAVEYLMSFLLIAILLAFARDRVGLGFLWLNSLIVGIELLFIFGGIWYCFQMNKKGDNKNFIERYICLSFPIGFRVLFCFVAFVLVLSLSDIILKKTIDFSIARIIGYSHWVDIFVVVAPHTLFYYWMGKSLKRLSIRPNVSP